MFDVVLFQPEIPPNTGNIMRLCSNTNSRLHLIEPLGFSLNDKQLKRAGLDYKDRVAVKLHEDFASYYNSLQDNSRIFLLSTKANTLYTDIAFNSNDALVFGPETRGLPEDLLQKFPEQQKLRIPMHKNGRSLNLATAVAIVLFEAWRQNNFVAKV